MSHSRIIVRLIGIFKIQLIEIIVFTEARVVKTTEVAASVASNIATAMLHDKFHLDPSNRLATIHQRHRQDRQDRTDNGPIA